MRGLQASPSACRGIGHGPRTAVMEGAVDDLGWTVYSKQCTTPRVKCLALLWGMVRWEEEGMGGVHGEQCGVVT